MNYRYFHYYMRDFANNHVNWLRRHGINASVCKEYEQTNNEDFTQLIDIPIWVIYTKIDYLQVISWLKSKGVY